MKNSIHSLGAQAVEAQVILDRIPVSWRTQLKDVMSVKTSEALPKLAAFLAEERRVAQVFPPFPEVCDFFPTEDLAAFWEAFLDERDGMAEACNCLSRNS